MISEFKKFNIKEFGENDYNKYYVFIRKNYQQKIIDKHTLFYDMYEKLKENNIDIIQDKQNRIKEVILNTFEIIKSYFLILIIYIFSMIIILMKGQNILFTSVASIIITISFLFKTYEFLINKFCYIDSQMIVVYKAVLDRLENAHNKRKQN